MYRLAHISDLHVSPLPAVPARLLLSKRILGYLSWHKRRKRDHRMAALEALRRDLEADPVDHICVTGDLTNIGLAGEFETAQRYLMSLGAPDRVSAIPGNHDAYVAGAFERSAALLAPYMTGDDGKAGFPWLRRRAGLSLIGVSSAVATLPAMASGRLGDAQRIELRKLLRQEHRQGRFTVVLIHHPPQRGAEPWRKALSDQKQVREILGDEGAGLVLHGHTHVPLIASIDGSMGPAPVLGAGSASLVGGRKGAGHYYRILIEKKDNHWHILAEDRHYDATFGHFSRGEIREVPTSPRFA